LNDAAVRAAGIRLSRVKPARHRHATMAHTHYRSEPAMSFTGFLRSFFASLCLFALFALVACAPTATREGTGEYVDDAVITTKVKAAFAADPAVKATEVKVETFKGTVQLSGFVASAQARQRAIEIARGTTGVRSVKDDMVLKQ
jgi:hypothetical protein